MSSNTASAPGKILLAGGYVVLEAPNIGLVVAADKRFYSTVKVKSNNNINNNNNENEKKISIVVESPQFHTSWEYTCVISMCCESEAETNVDLSAAETNDSENPFVEHSLSIVLSYITSLVMPPSQEKQEDEQQQQQQQQQGKESEEQAQAPATNTNNNITFPSLLHITIKADNDFYSVVPHLQGKPKTPQQVDALPKFLNCPKDPKTGKAIVHKTGLGSSAALVTSLVAALYTHFVPHPNDSNNNINNNEDEDEETNDNTTIINHHLIVHNLAQIAHCHAQGKVGSGFDVSAAMNGSHVYTRFPKCTLPDLLQQLQLHITPATCQVLQTVAQTQWAKNMVQPLSLPTGLQILLADVCGGSESPSMAKKVLSWKQSQFIQLQVQQQQQQQNHTSTTTAIPHWTDLITLNQKIVDLLKQLHQETIDTQTLSTMAASQWKELPDNTAASLLSSLHDTFVQARYHLKQMGNKAGVPIEPDEQTNLCDQTSALPGVVATLVPGAGGYDALACLYIDTPQTKQAIGQFWASQDTPAHAICPLSVQATNQGVLYE